jgi:uncharacterized FlaG/YvyC family protein
MLTITKINKKLHNLFVAQDTSHHHCVTIQETIDAKIIRDVPFDNHFSVIKSANHINKTLPIVSANAVGITTHQKFQTAITFVLH